MIAHLITRLSMGGAQELAINVAKNTYNSGEKIIFISGLAEEKGTTNSNNFLLSKLSSSEIDLKVIKELSEKVSVFKDIIAFFKICKIIYKYKPYILHIHSSKAGILGRLACIFFPTKAVFHVHGWSFSRSNDLYKKLYLSLEKFFFYLTDHFIFVCNKDRENFILLGGNKNILKKSSIIFPGANFLNIDSLKKHKDKKRKDLGFLSSEIVLGSIGRLDHQKDPLIFVETAKVILEKSKLNFKFLVIGSGELEEKTKNLVDKYGLSKNFVFTGFIEHVDPYFNVFDGFILTSKYEGLPVTVVKAISCNSLIFGFNVNGMDDLSKLFPSTVLTTKERNPRKLANIILEQFPKKKYITQKLLINSASVREKFSYNSMNASIIKTYDNL